MIELSLSVNFPQSTDQAMADQVQAMMNELAEKILNGAHETATKVATSVQVEVTKEGA